MKRMFIVLAILLIGTTGTMAGPQYDLTIEELVVKAADDWDKTPNSEEAVEPLFLLAKVRDPMSISSDRLLQQPEPGASPLDDTAAPDESSIGTASPAQHDRPTSRSATGRFRRLMQSRFERQGYRDGPQVETVPSMIQRRQESRVRGNTFWSQRRELSFRALGQNITTLFSRSLLTGQRRFATRLRDK